MKSTANWSYALIMVGLGLYVCYGIPLHIRSPSTISRRQFSVGLKINLFKQTNNYML